MTGPGAVVVLADDRPNGLATMLARLIESNLTHDPGRARLLRPAVVEIEAIDAGVAATVRTAAGRVEVASGRANPAADLSIRASSGDLLDLTAAPLWLGLPNPASRTGREVLRGVFARRVRIRGMFGHPLVLSRVARLLSVR